MLKVGDKIRLLHGINLIGEVVRITAQIKVESNYHNTEISIGGMIEGIDYEIIGKES